MLSTPQEITASISFPTFEIGHVLGELWSAYYCMNCMQMHVWCAMVGIENTRGIIDLQWHPWKLAIGCDLVTWRYQGQPPTRWNIVRKYCKCRKLESDHDKRPVHLVADRGPLMLEPRFVVVILIHIENEQQKFQCGFSLSYICTIYKGWMLERTEDPAVLYAEQLNASAAVPGVFSRYVCDPICIIYI